MQQVKLFKVLETEVDTLESKVNAWLAESGAKVVQIVGNIAPQSDSRAAASSTLGGGSTFAASDVLLIVLYET